MKMAYPVTFTVDFPDRDLDRLTTAFRIIVAIPIAFVLSLLTGQSLHYATSANGSNETVALATGGGLLFLPIVLMIVFRQKYPRWWFDWTLELLRLDNRVVAYLALMDDRYPSTDERQAVTLDFPYPDAKQGLNRWLPLVKWFLAIPHYIVLAFLGVAALVCVIFAWFAILFTGRYPRGLFDFVLGVMRWGNRVTAYAFVLVTDKYPPWELSS